MGQLFFVEESRFAEVYKSMLLCLDIYSLNVFITILFTFFVSQECDEYVLNDNTAGDIKILRSCLQLHNSEASRDDDVSHRRSKRIRRSSSVAVLSPDL